MQTRLISDLNRPDLGDIVIDYLQDAMRYFSRIAFFFTEVDNTAVPPWQPGTMYTLGATIHARVPILDYECAFVAMSPGINQSGATEPLWPEDEYLQWNGSWYYEPPPINEWGVVQDGDVIWANVGCYQPGYHTQLSTVPNQNQYIPPIDYVAPYMVQCTTTNLRLILDKISFEQLSRWDVVRPAPIAAYPRFWAFWQGQIYTWVYAMGFYPLTLNYTAAPFLPRDAADSNWWTTQGERLIRKYAQSAISREVLLDQQAAQLSMTAATEELQRLKAQAVAQQGYTIPPGDW